MTEAAVLLRMGRGPAHKAGTQQRLPAHQTGIGGCLVRPSDVERLVTATAFGGRQKAPPTESGSAS